MYHETLYQRQPSGTVRWFPLVEACLDVRCELEEGRCSRVSGSEAVLIFSRRFLPFLGMPAMRTRWMAGAFVHISG